MIRIFAVLGILAMLSACAPMATPEDPLADLGAFRLGHNVVVASKARTGPISRAATTQEWEAVMKNAIANRFGRYQGDQLYHLGISVEGFMLAPPGLPLVYTPKSALIVNVAAGAYDVPEPSAAVFQPANV